MEYGDTWLEILVLPAINYATQQNHVPIIRRLVIRNCSEEPWNDRRVSISTLPDFFNPLRLEVPALAPGESFEAKSVSFSMSSQFLTDLTEKVRGELECIPTVNRATRYE